MKAHHNQTIKVITPFYTGTEDVAPSLAPYSMVGTISDALIRRISDKISETARGERPSRWPTHWSRRAPPVPFDQPAVQHGQTFRNSGNHINSDYPKSSLTFISEYQKLMTGVGRR